GPALCTAKRSAASARRNPSAIWLRVELSGQRNRTRWRAMHSEPPTPECRAHPTCERAWGMLRYLVENPPGLRPGRGIADAGQVKDWRSTGAGTEWRQPAHTGVDPSAGRWTRQVSPTSSLRTSPELSLASSWLEGL